MLVNWKGPNDLSAPTRRRNDSDPEIKQGRLYIKLLFNHIKPSVHPSVANILSRHIGGCAVGRDVSARRFVGVEREHRTLGDQGQTKGSKGETFVSPVSASPSLWLFRWLLMSVEGKSS